MKQWNKLNSTINGEAWSVMRQTNRACSYACSMGLLLTAIIRDLLLAVVMVMPTTRANTMMFTWTQWQCPQLVCAPSHVNTDTDIEVEKQSKRLCRCHHNYLKSFAQGERKGPPYDKTLWSTQELNYLSIAIATPRSRFQLSEWARERERESSQQLIFLWLLNGTCPCHNGFSLPEWRTKSHHDDEDDGPGEAPDDPILHT